MRYNSFFPFSANSRREPEEPEDATKGRDVFNEKPPAEELMAVSDIGKAVTTSLPDSVVRFQSSTVPISVSMYLHGDCILNALIKKEK